MQDTGKLRQKKKKMETLVEKSMLGDMYLEFYNFDNLKEKDKMSEDNSEYVKSPGRKRMNYIDLAKENDLQAKKQRILVRRSILMISILLILLITLIFTELLYPLMSYLLDPLIDLLLNSVL
jgi:hypothetical protein